LKETNLNTSLPKKEPKEMTIKNLHDFKLGAGFASFCIFLLVFLIPNQVGPLMDSDALMPVIVTVIILLLSVLMMIKSVGQPKSGIDIDHVDENRLPTLSLWTVIAIMVTYSWLLEWTGFLLTSCIAMVVLFVVYGVKQYFRILLITFITLGLLYFSFEKLLFAPLPVGRLIENLM
jgi:hypothetical protein